MAAALIKSKLFNLVLSGRESLFGEDAGPPGRASLHQSRISPSAAGSYRGHDNDICVDSVENNPNFLAGCRAARQRCVPGLGVTEEHSARLSARSIGGLDSQPQSLAEISTTSASSPNIPSVLGLNRENAFPLHPPRLLAEFSSRGETLFINFFPDVHISLH